MIATTKETKSKSLSSNKKFTADDPFNTVQIKSIEQECLNRVFDQLCILEQEASSDDDSNHKKYLRQIETKAQEKKMKITYNNDFVSKTLNSSNNAQTKKFKEDEDFNQLNESFERKKALNEKKIGIKAIRKVLRKLANNYPKDEMKLMIWEVDENLDNFINKEEFERMYKRCICDLREQEPKKLFYLVQFLMYDKDNKGYITVEDTLEILYIRYGEQKFENALNNIFTENLNDYRKSKKPVIREKLSFNEYVERMHKLSLLKREEINFIKKNYDKYCKEKDLGNK